MMTTRRSLYVAEILALWALDRMIRRPSAVEVKTGPADYVTDTDREIEAYVRAQLAQHFPDHAVHGEEFGEGLGEGLGAGESADGTHPEWFGDGGPSASPSANPSVSPPSRPTWFVDPVDGTTNYAHDLPWHSFSLALHDAAGPVVAVVADAGRGEILSAARGLGARRDGVPITASRATDLAGTVLLTELAACTPWPGQLALLERMGTRQVTTRVMGSSALSLASVATGRAAAAVLGGGYHTWDVAAGALIAQEAGARMFAHDGTESARTDSPPLGGMLVAAPGIADALCGDLLASIASEAA